MGSGAVDGHGTPSQEIRYLASERRLTILPQSEGDLGDRLSAAFGVLRARGDMSGH